MASRMLIKPFSFVEYLSEDWLNPANPLFEEFGDGLDYAGSDSVSKVPLLMKFDRDWAFLSQFPPSKWRAALYWRYNEGLLWASELREKSQRKSVGAIPDWVPKLIINQGSEKLMFTGIEGKGIYVGYRTMFQEFEKPVKTHADYKAGVDYGYRPLANVSKEGPGIRDVDVFASGETPARELGGRAHHPRSAYRDGVIGMDMSRPLRVTPEFVDSLPDDDPMIQKVLSNLRGANKTPEKAREKLKAEPPHSLAGMPTMSAKTATNLLGLWIRAQGLGLLQKQALKVGDKLPDPLTGGEMTIVALKNPGELGNFPEFVGRNDAERGVGWKSGGNTVGGHRIPLQVPVVMRDIGPWYVLTAAKEQQLIAASKNPDDPANWTKKKGGPTEIPVLMSTTLLPTVQMSAEQKQQFDKRYGRTEDMETGQGPIEPKAGSAKVEGDDEVDGAVGEVLNLLQNWDLLSPEQIKHLMDNQRDELHVLARQVARADYDEKYKDQHAKKYYTIGWVANKANRGLLPHNLTKDQLKKVIEEYVPTDSEKLDGGLMGEAEKGITYYMKLALGYQGYQPKAAAPGKYDRNTITDNVRLMMEAALPSLVETCAILLALRLNDPNLGIYDPELGLTGVDPDFKDKPEATKARREMFAFLFAKDLSQAALVDTSYGTRRTRKKLAQAGMGGRREISYDGGGEQGGGGNIGGGEKSGRERAEERERKGAQYDVDIDPRKIWMQADPEIIARPGWLVPVVGTATDRFLQSKRNEIAKKAGPEYAIFLARAKTAMKRSGAIKEMLIEEKERELASQIADPNKRREAAASAVESNFKEELERRFPDLYGGLDRDQWNAVIQAATAKNKYRVGDPDEEQTPEEEAEVVADGGISRDVMNHLIEMNVDFLEQLLKYGSGDIYDIEYTEEDEGGDAEVAIKLEDVDAEQLAKINDTPDKLLVFMRKTLKLPDKVINDYFVSVWMELSNQYRDQDISLQQAIADAQRLKLSPKEAGGAVDTTQQQQPPTTKPDQPTPPPVAGATTTAQPVGQRVAAKDIGDLVNYIYEPMQPGEDPTKISQTIRAWLLMLRPQKAGVIPFFQKVIDRIAGQASYSKKDLIVLQLLGDFIEDDTPEPVAPAKV